MAIADLRHFLICDNLISISFLVVSIITNTRFSKL